MADLAILPLCYCADHGGEPHVHLPRLLDSNHRLPIVLAPVPKVPALRKAMLDMMDACGPLASSVLAVPPVRASSLPLDREWEIVSCKPHGVVGCMACRYGEPEAA